MSKDNLTPLDPTEKILNEKTKQFGHNTFLSLVEDHGSSSIVVEVAAKSAMQEHASNQAKAFDLWKEKEGWIKVQAEKYYANRKVRQEAKTFEELYTEFIEWQSKQ